jgi:hypothetical protein
MEHKRLVDLQNLADLRPVERTALTRDERLARWAEVLEVDPTRRLKPLHEIEYKKPDERRLARADNSPLTVAYEDSVLRAEGLVSDRLGDVMDFFGLTEHQAHVAFCSCHLGSSFEARIAARRVRSLIKAETRQRSGLRAVFAALFGL